MSYVAKTHPQQGYNEAVDDRATTWEDFTPLDRRFRFTIDVAASAENAKCDRFYTRDDDGLGQSWAGERVWCNPPYSVIPPWVEKAWSEAAHADLIVMLLPANRTEQRWWQDLVEPRRGLPESRLHVEFLPGRMRFVAPGAQMVRANERPPFGCCLLVWNDDRPFTELRRQLALGATR